MRYCVMESPKRKEFLEITRTQNYSFMDLKKKRNFSCTNHNAMLSMMQGALSGKTGFTGGAGYSYVGAFESDGRTFTIALLGCGWPPHKTYKWSDARKLYTYGMEHFHYQDVFQKQTLEPVVVEDGIGRDGEGGAQTGLTMNLSANEEHLELLLGKKDEVRVVKSLPKKLSAPVKKGDIVGTITYVLNGEPVKKYPVYASDSVLRIDFLWCLKSVGNRFLFQ